METHLNHNGWVSAQFDASRLKPSFRNVLIHVGLIEAALEKISINKSPLGNYPEDNMEKLYRPFRVCLKDLEIIDPIYNSLYGRRNMVVHRIIKELLDEGQIRAEIYGMHRSIIEIYNGSEEINTFFNETYKFLPRDRVSETARADSIET
jgi:hypothetical protein